MATAKKSVTLIKKKAVVKKKPVKRKTPAKKVIAKPSAWPYEILMDGHGIAGYKSLALAKEAAQYLADGVPNNRIEIKKN